MFDRLTPRADMGDVVGSAGREGDIDDSSFLGPPRAIFRSASFRREVAQVSGLR